MVSYQISSGVTLIVVGGPADLLAAGTYGVRGIVVMVSQWDGEIGEPSISGLGLGEKTTFNVQIGGMGWSGCSFLAASRLVR